ncbi:MAG: ABC transporter substrate-binding protein [Deltaproteobacteria bacterium]|nr:ABC transporter substrate-binding protein [Deltaproteobacteria bacterium]
MQPNFLRPFLVSLLCLFFVASAPLSAQAQSKKLAVGISALSAGYSPLYIAKDAGFFEKYGLSVELVLMQTGPIVHGMVAGDVKLAGVGATRIVASALEGSGIFMLASMNDRQPYVLLTPPDIKNASQLKGKKVGVTQFGGLDDTAMRFALQKLGLHPDKDVTIILAGGKATRFSALQKGAIAATVIDPPYTLEAKKLGLNFLFDFIESSPKTVYGTVSAKDSFVKQNPDIIRNFLKAYITAVQFYKARKPESIKIMAKYMRIEMPAKAEEMEDTYNAFVRTQKCKPYIEAENVQNLLNELAERMPKARSADPKKFLNQQFLKELDESGFIDSACTYG